MTPPQVNESAEGAARGEPILRLLRRSDPPWLDWVWMALFVTFLLASLAGNVRIGDQPYSEPSSITFHRKEPERPMKLSTFEPCFCTPNVMIVEH